MASAAYGSWRSPVKAELLAQGGVTLSPPVLRPADRVFWLEARPAEAGRCVLVAARLPTNLIYLPPHFQADPTSAASAATTGSVDVTPAEMSCRTRVHEYGGGAHCLDTAGDTLYFVDDVSRQLCRQRATSPGDITFGKPELVGPKSADLRYADMVLDVGGRLLYAVVEDHRDKPRDNAPRNYIGVIDLETDELHVVYGGSDFVSSPALSPDGTRLAFVAWDDPNMPWDVTRIHVARLGANGLPVAGAEAAPLPAAERPASELRPKWLDNATVLFTSDRSNGWWNLHVAPVGPDGCATGPVALFHSAEGSEFAGPHWQFGADPCIVLPGELGVLALYSSPTVPGTQAVLLTPGGTPAAAPTARSVPLPYASVAFHLSVLARPNGTLQLALLAGDATQPDGICVGTVTLTPPGGASLGQTEAWSWSTLRLSIPQEDAQALKGYLAVPEVVAFATTLGEAYCLYYAPTNRDYPKGGLDGEKPPLLIKIHGGPTSSVRSGFNLKVQYWTSRGFAVADVDYGGSTGYGRQYRERLLGQWGVVDVDDCANCALELAQAGRADMNRLTIDGGSAGGFTTLACLAFKPHVFKAGASHYGVSDLLLLAAETHKFEARYVDSLVGPLPESEAIFRSRSPLHAAEAIHGAVVFFHGDEDKVVPPNQAEVMYETLKAKGTPTAFVLFQGEQHGFRKAENICRALDGQLYFFSRVLHPAFEPDLSPGFAPYHIDNLASTPASEAAATPEAPAES